MKRSPLAVVLLCLAVALAACGGGGSKKSSSSSGGTASTSSSCTGSLAWCAPVGDPVEGLTLSDGWEDPREVPYPVNVTPQGWTDSVAVTPDGLHLYFAYSKYNLGEFFTFSNGGGGTQFDPTGPARTVENTGNPFKIFRADLSSGGWTVIYHPVNDPDQSIWEASASPNEAGDILVFSKFDSSTFVSTMWFSQLISGNWTSPTELPLASPTINANCAGSNDDNGFITQDTSVTPTLITLTWESRRTDDAGTCGANDAPHHLYQSTTTDGATWTTIQQVPGLNVVGDSDDTQPSFSPDGLTAYWTSLRTYNSAFTYGVFTADWDSGTSSYINAHPIVQPTTTAPYTGKAVIAGEFNVAEVSEGWIAYFMCGVTSSENLTPNQSHEDVTLSVCRVRKPR